MSSITIPNPVPHSRHRLPVANPSPNLQFKKIKIGIKTTGPIKVENEVLNIIRMYSVVLTC